MTFHRLALPALLALTAALQPVEAAETAEATAAGGARDMPAPASPRDRKAAAVEPSGPIRDVGDGLAYARVTRAPVDLPTPEQLAGRAVILDLRFAQDDGTAAAPLTALLRTTAGLKRPVFVLFNAATSERLIATVRALDDQPGLMTIAPAGTASPADFTVVTTGEDEQRAYDAFQTGKSVVELTTDLPEKRRNDEASLTQPAPRDDGDTSADEAVPLPESTAKKPKPVIDAPLQRAVHLYRGLRALKIL